MIFSRYLVTGRGSKIFSERLFKLFSVIRLKINHNYQNYFAQITPYIIFFRQMLKRDKYRILEHSSMNAISLQNIYRIFLAMIYLIITLFFQLYRSNTNSIFILNRALNCNEKHNFNIVSLYVVNSNSSCSSSHLIFYQQYLVNVTF